ncbi:helix-turn-helix-domain containing protein, AraC type [Elusimicrobium minutum Pei191]|uniref:Helix-turn-helix-domain containing protein, AraC type n=1 Tax=Elusimicrobium minutum (strain Pei191) TaxID=445932 RepID=B2KDG7_ELUMP|nr:hypothetical protein [Elusimicrobium minutum]ACC98563.1 helix-turn-helix-domain containing protein, AraC type [Elusimicrobium minutum Pei191]
MPEQEITVKVRVLKINPKKAIIKRGAKAKTCKEYLEENGSEIWNKLRGIKNALFEPIGILLTKELLKPGTSEYVQGVVMHGNYDGKIPEGFEIIDIPSFELMLFQGPVFDEDRAEEAIAEIRHIIEEYDPRPEGFAWAPEEGPIFQPEPRGYRGYIEARPVKRL